MDKVSQDSNMILTKMQSSMSLIAKLVTDRSSSSGKCGPTCTISYGRVADLWQKEKCAKPVETNSSY